MSTARDIDSVLRRHLGQRTVLGVAIPVLEATIAAMKSGASFDGIDEKAIQQGFKVLGSRYLRSDFHPTYIERRLGQRGFLELNGNYYSLRAELLAGVSIEELEALLEDLEVSLKSAFEARQALIAELEALGSLPPESIVERHRAVDGYLSMLSGNRGEHFEVVSFAVLREYFRTFGFELRRFSTVHANDGGMDFVAGNAIYQVTVDESVDKVRRDLRKLPGAKRVLVRPAVSEGFSRALGEDVLETIELRDLLDHFLEWLLRRDRRTNQATHLQQVIRVALEEFRRENHAEGADNAD